MILMGPLLILDPAISTPLNRWLAKTVATILPSFAGISRVNLSLITRDGEQVTIFFTFPV
jgi:hypothetical protein